MTNTIACVVTTVFTIAGGTLNPQYAFFATVEVGCMALIVWFAWQRPRTDTGSPAEHW